MKPRPQPTLSGDLGTTSIASLLWSARQRDLTGTLSIQGECYAGVSPGETLVTFKEGALTQIRQPQPLDTLGCVLREQGTITGEQFDESLARMASREGLQGKVLVAMGACNDEAVSRALRVQLRRKAQRLFALEKGAMAFFRGVDLLADFGAERRPEDVLPLLWPGLRAYPDHGAVQGAMTRLGMQSLRLLPNVGLTGFGFDAAETKALEALRPGPATFAALTHAGCTAATARSLVALLLITGLAELTDEKPRLASGVQPVLQQRAPEPARQISSSNLPAVRDLGIRPDIIPQSPPRVAAPKPPPVDVRARLVAAEARLAAMQDETYFQMLGVAPAAAAPEVRTAYAERSAQWRPEAVPPSALALREVHQRVQALLDEAHAALTDEESRRQHFSEIVAGAGTPNGRMGLAAQADAQTKLHTAEVCLRCGAFDEASKLAREALAAQPELAGAIVVLVAALLAKDPRGQCIEAIGWVTRGLKLTPDDDQMQVLAGRAYARRGDEARSLEHFIRAYKLNSTNMDAVRELRAIAARRRTGRSQEVAAVGGGLLSRIFGR